MRFTQFIGSQSDSIEHKSSNRYATPTPAPSQIDGISSICYSE
jgi:hypothetical protein